MSTKTKNDNGSNAKARQVEAVRKVSLLQSRLKRRELTGATSTVGLRTLRGAMVLTGFTNPKAVVLTPSEFGKLEVDEYQRELQPRMISELIRALRAGGISPAPV